MPRFGLTHVTLPVRDLALSRLFYQQGLGFQDAAPLVAGQSHVDLDSGGPLLRLEEHSGEVHPQTIHPQTIRLQTTRIDRGVESVLSAGGRLLRAPSNTVAKERVAVLEDPDGHRLHLWRRLREDEWATPPELPCEVPWSEEALVLVQKFLSRAPAAFRDLARKGCVREAEFLAGTELPIQPIHVARALIRSTPRLMRFRVRPTLLEHGFEPADFEDDFRA